MKNRFVRPSGCLTLNTLSARFESDGEGEFEVLLAAGVYSIVPDESTPVPYPWSLTKTVTVPEDGFAVVTLSFDTGLR